MYAALTKQMQSNELLLLMPVDPFTGLSYQGIVQKLRSFKSPQWQATPTMGPIVAFIRLSNPFMVTWIIPLEALGLMMII